jgi:hypothetical protein
VRLAVLPSLMLPPATLPASSAFQRLAAAGECKKNKVIFCFYFLFGICHAVNRAAPAEKFLRSLLEKSFYD